MTFAGTQLDTDSRYFKAFATGRKIICQAIDRLRELAPVHVVTVQGNHDTMSAWHLGDSLECYFRNTPDVLVDNQPKLRKYVSFGKVGLMFTHGDKSKATDWPMIFASEMSKMFGETKFREIHTGHLHQTRLIEKNGVRVRISPALCSEDAWHSERGFVGNLRGAEAYIWSKDEGLVSTVFFNVKE
jgi:DNA repair exonuclease SbcCD nuclease subunit